MRRLPRLEVAASIAVGLLFGIGLQLSGMSNPAKVLAFLDVGGQWDPSLALVMAGAIAVGVIGFAFVERRVDSALGLPMRMPAARSVDRRLLAGAVVFGAGWGLVGLCPGPALLALASGSIEALVFALAMVGGMALFEFTLARRAV